MTDSLPILYLLCIFKALIICKFSISQQLQLEVSISLHVQSQSHCKVKFPSRNFGLHFIVAEAVMNSHINQFSHTFNLDKIVEGGERRELISEVANTVGNDLSNDLQISMSKLAYYSS